MFQRTPVANRVAPRLDSAVVDADPAQLIALIQSGYADQAERQLRARLQIDPDEVDALHLLGLLCHQSGRGAEAVELIGRAVALAPGVAFIQSNFAEALRQQGEALRAEHHAREALRLMPEHLDSQFNLASVLVDQDRLTEAIEVIDRMLVFQPQHAEALSLKSELFFKQERNAEALVCAEAARNLAPDDLRLLGNLLRQRAWACDWAKRAADVAAFSVLAGKVTARAAPVIAKAGDGGMLFGTNPFICHEYQIPQAQRIAVTGLHVDRVIRASGAPMEPVELALRSDLKRLRIGYVSADFHSHPTMHLMGGLFELHDRARFEIFAYSIGADDYSAYRRRARDSVDHFVDIRSESPRQSAERMRGDGIDILVDLKGFTHEARPGIFALRPAPIQAAWLGYPASTDGRLNDYVIVDRITVPPAHAGQFREQLVWLPHSYQVNDHCQPVVVAAPARHELGLPESGFVYACFNHVYKIEPDVFASWMRILGRVPGSVLWLYSSNVTARANLAREAEAHGIRASRIVFGATLDKPRHLARLACADLFLDTGTINAHTSASDALWAGLPVLTRPGNAFAGRVGASLVSAAGLPQLVCGSVAQYEEIAVRLANSPAELEGMRKVLQARERLPLFDTPRFARNLERAFEMMWARYLAGLPPVSFAVADADSEFVPAHENIWRSNDISV